MLDLRMPVTEALYQAEGNPVLDKAGEPQIGSRCGNCRRRVLTVKASSVLTSRFGSWDDIAVEPDGGRYLCFPCAWTYRCVPLRRTVTLVTAEPSLTHPSGVEVRTLLSRALTAQESLIVPLSGKRIVAPRARWGQVTVDSKSFTWSPSHRRLLLLATQLRGWGFRERGLLEPSPPFETLSRIEVGLHEEIRSAWSAFEPARDDKTLIGLYLRLSRETL